MKNIFRKPIIGSMIALASMSGCEQAPRKVKTLNSYMANRPEIEYTTIKRAWREGLAKPADKQHSLDSVAFSRLLLEKTHILNNSKRVEEFNKIAQRTRLKNDSNYTTAYNELDKKMIDAKISKKQINNNKKEYAKNTLTYPNGLFSSTEIPNEKQILKLRQYKLDSLEYGNYIKKHSPHTIKEFKKVAESIKP